MHPNHQPRVTCRHFLENPGSAAQRLLIKVTDVLASWSCQHQQQVRPVVLGLGLGSAELPRQGSRPLEGEVTAEGLGTVLRPRLGWPSAASPEPTGIPPITSVLPSGLSAASCCPEPWSPGLVCLPGRTVHAARLAVNLRTPTSGI